MKQAYLMQPNTGRTKQPPTLEQQAAALSLIFDGRTARQRRAAQFNGQPQADDQQLLPSFARESTGRTVRSRRTTTRSSRPLTWSDDKQDGKLTNAAGEIVAAPQPKREPNEHKREHISRIPRTRQHTDERRTVEQQAKI